MAKPSSGGQRFPGLEGVRTVGVVAVFLNHVGYATGWTSNGTGFRALGRFVAWGTLIGHFEFAVAIFFMISAFLLYRPFVTAAFLGRPMPSAAHFLRRRFFRAFPAYWVLLVILLVTGRIHPESWLHGLRIFTLTQIYTDHAFFAVDVLVPTWTLATELTFYFFLVAYATVLRRAGTGRAPQQRLRLELGAAGGLVVFAFAWRALVYAGHGIPHVAEHWLPGTIDIFGLGLALAAIDAYVRAGNTLPRPTALLARHPDLCAVAGFAFFFAVPAFTDVSTTTGFSTGADAFLRDALQLLSALFLLFPAAFGDSASGRYLRFLTWRPIAYTGLVSYGIYLWHDLWIKQAIVWAGGQIAISANFWLIGVTAFALSLACGALSFRCIEQPMLLVEARVPHVRVRGRGPVTQ